MTRHGSPDVTPATAGLSGAATCEVPRPEAVRSVGTMSRFALRAVRSYQLLRTGRTSPCRFTPTCSHYAYEAIERRGLRSGLRLTLGRLGRCRPGGPFGYDPVPE